MNLFLMRHGIAVESISSTAASDNARPLSEEGIEKTRAIARAVKKLGIRFDIILSSPYARARQTAEIVANQLELNRKLDFTKNLTPEGSSEELVRMISKDHPDAEDVLLVGHEPQMSGLISLFISGPAGAEIVMKKGGICKISTSNLRLKKCAVLEWLLTPKQLMKISES